jgi:hypothetical protein
LPENVVQEIILLVAVVTLGLAVIALSITVLYPQFILSSEEQVANNLASQTTISVGPLLNNGNQASLVLEAYDPAETGNVTVLVFPEPSSFETSVGLVTPQGQPSFSVHLANGKLAEPVTLAKVYDLNGHLLIGSPIRAYTIPFNDPVTVIFSGFSKGDIAVVWVMYGQGDVFRIGYTFTGVPG